MIRRDSHMCIVSANVNSLQNMHVLCVCRYVLIIIVWILKSVSQERILCWNNMCVRLATSYQSRCPRKSSRTHISFSVAADVKKTQQLYTHVYTWCMRVFRHNANCNIETIGRKAIPREQFYDICHGFQRESEHLMNGKFTHGGEIMLVGVMQQHCVQINVKLLLSFYIFLKEPLKYLNKKKLN